MNYLKAFVLGIALSLSPALAQPLAELAPADTLLSLGWNLQGGVFETLDDDIKALAWDSARATLEKLAAVMASQGDTPEIAEMLGALNSQDAAVDELVKFCPAFEEMLGEFEAFKGKTVPFDALLTLGMSSFSPMPSVTGLLRLDESYAPLMIKTRDILMTCATESGEMSISTLEQDGTTLYVLDDAGDFPIALGNIDNLFFFSSNPEALRSVVRIVNGSDEPSLADTAMYQEAMAKLGTLNNGLGLGLDFGSLADVLEGFADFVDDSPEGQYASTRLLSLLRTLGNVSGQLSATAAGLQTDIVMNVNPEGGDEALLKLLLCESCQVSSPFLAPDNAVSVSLQYLPWRELYSYLESWVAGLAEATGEPLDLKQLLKDEFGFDLDTAIFNWLGSEAHTYVLEPISTDLRTLIYNPAQITLIPVSSPEAAQQGLGQLGQVLEPLFMMIMDEATQDADFAQMFGGDLSRMVALRNYDYKGVTIQRLQLSANADLGYGFVGNYLVLGRPARAVEMAVDTFQGGKSLAFDQSFGATRATMPEKLSALSYSNNKIMLAGLADILEAVSQPLAFFIQTGLQAALAESNLAADSGYYADISGVVAEPLAAPAEITGTLTAPEVAADNTFAYYELQGLAAGDTVSVRLESADFDTYLKLIDASSQMVIFDNDDFEGSYNASQINFTAQEGVTYWVEVSNPYSDSGGSYSLSLNLAESSDDLENFFGYDAVLSVDSAEALSLGSSLSGTIAGAPSSSKLAHYYELSGLSVGDTVKVRMSSADFDTYLAVIDATLSEYLLENDYGDDFEVAELSFTVEENRSYWLEASSYYSDEGGNYDLSVEIVAADAMEPELTAEDLPSFVELLELLELLPKTMRVLANHSSTSESYTTLDGNTIQSHSLMHLTW